MCLNHYGIRVGVGAVVVVSRESAFFCSLFLQRGGRVA